MVAGSGEAFVVRSEQCGASVATVIRDAGRLGGCFNDFANCRLNHKFDLHHKYVLQTAAVAIEPERLATNPKPETNLSLAA